MASKLLFTLCPLLGALAPVCSTSLPLDLTVFASMMNKDSLPGDIRSVTNEEKKNREQISFEETFRVMTFNIHSDVNDEPRVWDDRKQLVASTIRFHRADLIGLQEPSFKQLTDLIQTLPEFKCFEGASLGELHNPIFFRKSRFDLLDAGSFHLSSTPDLPGKGWDAKYPRAVSWAKLLDKKLRKEFFFFNTHFDYHGRLARDESARLLRLKVAEIAGPSSFIAAGDFNLFPALGGQETYQILTDHDSPPVFKDAQPASLFPHHGPTGTWSGFQEAGQPGIKPDCIFVSSKIEVYLHGILGDHFDGKFPSDHLPVVADLSLK